MILWNLNFISSFLSWEAPNTAFGSGTTSRIHLEMTGRNLWDPKRERIIDAAGALGKWSCKPKIEAAGLSRAHHCGCAIGIPHTRTNCRSRTYTKEDGATAVLRAVAKFRLPQYHSPIFSPSSNSGKTVTGPGLSVVDSNCPLTPTHWRARRPGHFTLRTSPGTSPRGNEGHNNTLTSGVPPARDINRGFLAPVTRDPNVMLSTCRCDSHTRPLLLDVTDVTDVVGSFN